MKKVLRIFQLKIKNNWAKIFTLLILRIILFRILNQNWVISLYYSWNFKFRNVLFWIRVLLWVMYTTINFSLNISFKWVMALGLIILPFFSSNQFWWLMIWFEISLFPIMILIVGFGAQRVRFPAALYIMLYTLVFSLPGIAILLSRDWLYNFLLPLNNLSKISLIIMVLMFMVKVPVFGLHIWLPKAHVESPTLGSIILAGVLLKIGVYGLWIFLNWGQAQLQLAWFLLGGFLGAILAVVQRDLKRVVAFSSVAHLNLALAAGLTLRRFGESSLLILRFLHGRIRSILFLLVGISSFISKSRLLFYLKVNSTIFWLLALRFNIGLPPCPSFWPEFFSGFRLGLMSLWNLPLFFLGGISLAWFTILNWLRLKFSSYQSLSIMTKTQLCFLWTTFLMWVNLIWFW